MMKFYISHHEYKKALDIFNTIQTSNTLINNNVMYLMALTASSNLKSLNTIKSIHKEMKQCKIENVNVYNALIGAYSKCNDIQSAQHVFKSMVHRDAITHNVILTALQDNGHNHKVIEFYHNMNAVYISHITYFIVLRALSNDTELVLLRTIHQNIITQEMNTNIKLMNAIIAAYGKCGDIIAAQSLFNEINGTNNNDIGTVISMIGAFGATGDTQSAKQLFTDNIHTKDAMLCAAIMSAYQQNECFEAIIDLYHDICNVDIQLNDVCYLMVLKACAKSGLYEFGKTIQKHLENTHYGRRMLRENVFLQTQMIDVYGKCGECEIALKYFKEQINDEIKRSDVVIWTSIIQCFGMNGKADVSLKLFREMTLKYGLSAEHVTYFVLIHVLSHCQMMHEAALIFNESRDKNKCNEKTFCAMIDCFARNNELESGYKLLMEYEALHNINDNINVIKSYHQMLIALLNGCRKYNHLKMAKIIYRKIQKTKFDTKEDVRRNADTLMRDIVKCAQKNTQDTSMQNNMEKDLQQIIHKMYNQ